jgi:PAS domain S-box-containing protein
MTESRAARGTPLSSTGSGPPPDLGGLAQAQQPAGAEDAFNRAILDAVGARVAVLDEAGTIIAVNGPWRQGTPETSECPGQVALRPEVGSNYLRVCQAARDRGTEGAGVVHDGIRAVLTRKAERFTHQFSCHARERTRWFLLTATALDQPHGGAVISLTDISAPIELSGRLTVSNERLGLAQNSAGAGFWDWDMRRGTLAWSDELFGLFGLDPARDTASFATWRGIVHPEDVADAEQRMLDAARTGRSLSSEYRIVSSAGDIRWIQALGKPALNDAGEAVRMAGICLDVTTRKEAQCRLSETSQRLQALMDALPVGVSFSEDRACHHISGNPALLTQFEATADDNISASAPDPSATGRRVRYFHQGRELSDRELPLQRAARDGAAIPPTEIEIRLPSGRHWFAEVSGAPVRNPQGEVIGGVAVALDVSDRRRADEALREADRRKDEFLATLAHELRNPLVPICNAAQIIRHQVAPDPTLHRACDLLDRQAQHLVRLVDDLLDVSRISRGQLRVRQERVELAAVLEQSLDVARALVEAAGQDLAVSLPERPVYLDADAVRLAQAFSNLLDNASKFSPRGSRIRLSADCDGTEARVRVEDSGSGIDPEHRAGIFDMFTQWPAAPDQVRSGLGIGLALTRSLVQMHGGCIEAHSEGLGLGSTFTVRLPVAAAPPGLRRESVRTDPKHIADPYRILVVDDQPDVRGALAMLLESQGYAVATARDGLEAIDAGERFRPDLMLLDLGMPRLDGYEACRRIRQRAWGKGLKIFALSGWGPVDVQGRTHDAGFDDHLVKPIAPSALLEIVAKAYRS